MHASRLHKTIGAAVLGGCLWLAGCARPAPPDLLADIVRIRAIDNHAHPVAVTGAGQQDREFDALPVDNMEPSSDPVNMKPGPDGTLPGVMEAWHSLYAYPFDDARPEHRRELTAGRQKAMQAHADGYPAWVLDEMGVDVMLANRVHMGRGIQPPRFRWVPYADALLFPLDNSHLASRNSDRKAFLADEDVLLHRYLTDAGLTAPPATLDAYLTRVVTPTLARQKQGGAVAEKFEAAYLRSLAFDAVDRASADKVYAQYRAGSVPPDEPYKLLQDYLFRYIAAECGRLGMAVHIHTMAGAGSYFDVGGANPLLLESVLNDPGLRKTRFVMLHGGWPFTREITALLTKPNAYLDYSQQSLLLTPATEAGILREWLEYVPEKVMFATDAYPYSEDMGWEESGWIAAGRGRQALALALGNMMRDGEISRDRALQLARMVLRDNARALYGL
ncbi:MAG TPA: amidohydrolase family protein [Bryobacteraceae bacterium]|nr:amidohydrolase family protein [Bryobacteraceae bacterium]